MWGQMCRVVKRAGVVNLVKREGMVKLECAGSVKRAVVACGPVWWSNVRALRGGQTCGGGQTLACRVGQMCGGGQPDPISPKAVLKAPHGAAPLRSNSRKGAKQAPAVRYAQVVKNSK